MRISKQQLIRAAFSGLKAAERTFSCMSANNLLFSHAPEYLLTSHIAETLHKAAPNHMTWLEFQLNDARVTPPGGLGAAPDRRQRGGRCDILMCWACSGEPRAAFEVKRDVHSLHLIKSDTERLIGLLNGGVEGNTLQFGAVVFSTMADCVHGKKIIRERAALFRQRLSDWQCAQGYGHMRLNLICGEIKKRPAGDHWAPMALVCERVADKTRSRRKVVGDWTRGREAVSPSGLPTVP